VSFAKTPQRSFQPGRGRFHLPRVPPFAVVRFVLLAALGIAGAVWGLVRHYTHPLPPMRVPVSPAPAPTYDPDAGEMPVPDFELGEPSEGG
jgi:hypothetical protein